MIFPAEECDAQLFLQAFDDEDLARLQAIAFPSAIQAFCPVAVALYRLRWEKCWEISYGIYGAA